MTSVKSRKSSKVKVSFIGQNATGVTGSSILLEFKDTKILLELGMSQESTMLNNYRNNESFINSVNFKDIDYIILCDSHVDHSALIPAAFRKHFDGYVIMTPNAARVTKHLMEDCAHIMEKDVEYMKKVKGTATKVFYDGADIKSTFENVIEVPLNVVTKLRDSIEIEYLRNNHNIGSASLAIYFTEKSGRKKKLFYSSDLGNVAQKMPFTRTELDFCKTADVAIFESTYGVKPERVLNGNDRRSELFQLKNALVDTIVNKSGTVICPVFAFQRSQQFLKHLKTIMDKEPLLCDVPVIVDGRLMQNLNKEFLQMLEGEQLAEFEEIMNWHNLIRITNFEETTGVLNDPRPKIIVASSGMASNGKVVAYLEKFVGKTNTLLVFNGYCSQNSLGHKLLEKLEDPEKAYIKIGDRTLHYRASIMRMYTFSSHMQYDDLIDMVCKMNVSKGIYLVHGDTKSKQSLLEGIEERLQQKNKTTQVKIPRRNSSIEF